MRAPVRAGTFVVGFVALASNAESALAVAEKRAGLDPADLKMPSAEVVKWPDG